MKQPQGVSIKQTQGQLHIMTKAAKQLFLNVALGRIMCCCPYQFNPFFSSIEKKKSSQNMYFYSLKMGCKKLDISQNYESVLTVVGRNPTTEKIRVEQKSNIEFWCVNYYPYHSIMPGRNYNSTEYRYGGANGQEKVDEIKGSGNHYTADYWEYDPRVVTRWNRDPVVKHDQSPYSILAGNPIWFIDPLGADSSLYNSGTGAFMARGITPEDDKTAIWTVDPTAKGYDKDNPWATAQKLTYSVGEKQKKEVGKNNLRENHPLAGKGWTYGTQVYEEDLLDMTSDFNGIVNQWKPHFAQKGAEWDKAAQDWLDCWLCAINPSGYTDLLLGKKAAFVGMVGPNMPFDLKSRSRGNLQQIPSYAAVVIGQYSFYQGRLMNYDDYGNAAFGAWGRAYGYGISTLTQGADIDQIFHTGSGDPGRDQYMIKLGFRLFK